MKYTRQEIREIYRKVTGRGRCDECDSRRKLFEVAGKLKCYECCCEN